MKERSGVRQVVGLVVTSLLSTPLMMVQMAALQLVSLDTQGMPSVRSLVAVLILYIGVVSYSWGGRKMERRSVRVLILAPTEAQETFPTTVCSL